MTTKLQMTICNSNNLSIAVRIQYFRRKCCSERRFQPTTCSSAFLLPSRSHKHNDPISTFLSKQVNCERSEQEGGSPPKKARCILSYTLIVHAKYKFKKFSKKWLYCTSTYKISQTLPLFFITHARGLNLP